MVIFHSYVNVYQRVNPFFIPVGSIASPPPSSRSHHPSTLQRPAAPCPVWRHGSARRIATWRGPVKTRGEKWRFDLEKIGMSVVFHGCRIRTMKYEIKPSKMVNWTGKHNDSTIKNGGSCSIFPAKIAIWRNQANQRPILQFPKYLQVYFFIKLLSKTHSNDVPNLVALV